MTARLVFVLACLVASQARGSEPTPDDEVARVQFADGEQAYVAGQYVRALQAFEKAYALSHRPALLYNIGVCLEALGRFADAVGHYRRYLAETQAPVDRERVQERIDSLEASLAQAAQLDATRSQVTERAVARPPRRPVYKRGWFWGVLTSSVIVVGAGLGIGLGLGLRRGQFEPNIPIGGPGAR